MQQTPALFQFYQFQLLFHLVNNQELPFNVGTLGEVKCHCDKVSEISFV